MSRALVGCCLAGLAVAACGGDEVDGQAVSGPSTSTTSSTTTGTSTSPPTSDEPELTQSPNAAGYEDDDGFYFQSPSGNFLCGILPQEQLDEVSGAGCHGATDPIPPRPASCGEGPGWGQGMQVSGTGAVSFLCVGGLVYGPGQGGPPATLPYGQSITANGFTCTSAESGVRCIHDETGHGFRIASRSNETF